MYKQFIEDADKLVLTEIDATCETADTYFPEFDNNEWNKENTANSKNSCKLLLLYRESINFESYM